VEDTVTDYLVNKLLDKIAAAEYGNGSLVDALAVVVNMHKPHKIRYTDSTKCKVHNPMIPGYRDFSREEIDDCPVCVVTHPDRCVSRTCMDCGNYPCETLLKIAEVIL
jgi:hypothetical protein